MTGNASRLTSTDLVFLWTLYFAVTAWLWSGTWIHHPARLLWFGLMATAMTAGVVLLRRWRTGRKLQH
jgi:Na+-driven multidrug efflux pump